MSLALLSDSAHRSHVLEWLAECHAILPPDLSSVDDLTPAVLEDLRKSLMNPVLLARQFVFPFSQEIFNVVVRLASKDRPAAFSRALWSFISSLRSYFSRPNATVAAAADDDDDIVSLLVALHELLLPPAPAPAATSPPFTPPRSSVTGTQSLSIAPTPLKSSVSGQTDTRRKNIDPRLVSELTGFLWLADWAFFDRFFPAAAGADFSLDPFPSEPDEASVVDWFQRVSEGFSSVRTPNCAWRSSGTRPLYHVNTSRKVDLFTYPIAAGRSTQRPAWSEVLVVGELKHEKGLGDLNPRVVIQTASYALEVFSTQPGRRFVHAFTVINNRMRCWIFTRGCAVASPRIDLTDQDHVPVFKRIFSTYMTMSTENLGMAPEISTLGQRAKYTFEASIDGTDLTLLRSTVFQAKGIITRATTCWRTAPASSEKTQVLKESWQWITDRPTEGELLQIAHNAGVQGVVEYHAYEEAGDIHSILGAEIVRRAVPLLLSETKRAAGLFDEPEPPRKRLKTDGDAPAAASLSRSSGRHRRGQRATARGRVVGAPAIKSCSNSNRSARRTASIHSQTMPPPAPPHSAPLNAAPLEADPAQLISREYTPSPGAIVPNVAFQYASGFALDPVKSTTPTIHNRRRRRLLMSEGKAVFDVEFTDAPLLLACMRDAIRGHRSLLEKANILHRDISCNNIMLATSPRSDGFKGFLIDLDLAILLDTEHGYEHRRSGAPKRTGTFEFMSVDMLLGSPDFQHCYYDDLQSFLFVLIYLCTKAGDHRNELLSVWGGMCAESAGRIKHSDMTKDQCFEKLLSRFKPELGKPVCEVVDRFRRILFPSGSEFNRRVLADETVGRKMYDDVLAVFDAEV